MSSNTDREPISFLERRALRSGEQRVALTPEQQRAYRQMAIVALGIDVPTLTAQLRARRLQAMPLLRIVPPTDLAA